MHINCRGLSHTLRSSQMVQSSLWTVAVDNNALSGGRSSNSPRSGSRGSQGVSPRPPWHLGPPLLPSSVS